MTPKSKSKKDESLQPEPEVFDAPVAVEEPKTDDAALISKLSKNTEKPKQKIPKEPEVYIFKLLGNYPTGFPKYESMSNEMPIFDEGKNENRTIRLLRGVSSIYVDEQVGLTPQYVQRNKIDVIFLNGFLRIPRTNRTMLNFVLSSDEYDKKANRMRSRKPRFTLINTADIEQKELDKEELKFKAVTYAMNAKEEDMIPHAMYLKINMVNNYGEAKSPAKIRVEYAEKAQQNPDLFMKTTNSPFIKAAYFVAKGIEAGVIDLSKRQGYAVWRDSGYEIVELKFGKPVVDTIAEFALSESKEASDFYKQLKSVL